MSRLVLTFGLFISTDFSSRQTLSQIFLSLSIFKVITSFAMAKVAYLFKVEHKSDLMLASFVEAFWGAPLNSSENQPQTPELLEIEHDWGPLLNPSIAVTRDAASTSVEVATWALELTYKKRNK